MINFQKPSMMATFGSLCMMSDADFDSVMDAYSKGETANFGDNELLAVEFYKHLVRTNDDFRAQHFGRYNR
jgi:hypothetical protein